MYDSAAHDILHGKVIGWFQGRMEWGPRSLGGRSILASPLKENIRDRINSKIKYRELFRPFAPIMLESFFKDFTQENNTHQLIFDAHYLMLSTVEVSVETKKKYPACVHVNNTARVQLVKDSSDHPIACLLRKVKSLGHPPILINTSYNFKGEPVVCSPSNALATFYRSDLDRLYISSYQINQLSF